MKKQLIIGLLMVVGLAMTGCREAPECKYHATSIYLEVQSNEWKYDTDLRQYYAHFDLPAITANIYNYGNYSLHREYNTNTKDVYQVALPQSILNEEIVTNDDGTTASVFYTQLVDYRVGIGYVEIQVTNSDYFYPSDNQGYLINPETMIFHLQLIY